MHLLKYSKPPKDRPFIQIKSHWEVPEYRRLRGKRYDSSGKQVAVTGLKNRPDEIARKALLEARAKAKKMPRPVDTDGFDITRFTPLPGRMLLSRPPQIKEVGGVALPDNLVRSEPYFVVVMVAPGVTACKAGDRVLLQKGHKPKEAWLGKKIYLGRETAVVGIML